MYASSFKNVCLVVDIVVSSVLGFDCRDCGVKSGALFALADLEYFRKGWIILGRVREGINSIVALVFRALGSGGL